MRRIFNPCDDCDYSFGKQNQSSRMCDICEFKKYQDLDYKNLLIRLPCRVGDAVYVFKERNHYTAMEVNEIEIKHTLYGGICYLLEPVGRRGCLYRYFEDDFGKVVFLTQPEAEEVLQRMNETEGTT